MPKAANGGSRQCGGEHGNKGLGFEHISFVIFFLSYFEHISTEARKEPREQVIPLDMLKSKYKTAKTVTVS